MLLACPPPLRVCGLAFIFQGSGLRSLEKWVVQFRDEAKLSALITVIGCLKMLPVDLQALKASSIGQVRCQ